MCARAQDRYTDALTNCVIKGRKKTQNRRQRAELPACEAPPQKGLADSLALEVSGASHVGHHNAARQVFIPAGECLCHPAPPCVDFHCIMILNLPFARNLTEMKERSAAETACIKNKFMFQIHENPHTLQPIVVFSQTS